MTKTKTEARRCRVPKLSFQDWSSEWKEARNKVGEIELISNLWNKMPTHQWARKKLLATLGFRKNNDNNDKGEQAIERLLLGERGEIRELSLLLGGVSLRFEALRHNVALSNYQTGQVIVDAVGKVLVSRKWHPLAIEIKNTQGNCWSAVVQNIQQIRMLRADEKNNKDLFNAAGGAWGVVLAPKTYFTNSKHANALEKSKKLLEMMKERHHLRVALCNSDCLKEGKIECFWSNWG
jgi:hypothetical protein